MVVNFSIIYLVLYSVIDYYLYTCIKCTGNGYIEMGNLLMCSNKVVPKLTS